MTARALSKNCTFVAPLVSLLLLGAARVTLASSYTVLRDSIAYDINPDATYTYEEQLAIRIDDAQALTQVGQIPLEFSDSMQSVKVLEAYTTTNAGQRVDVAPDRIIVQQLPASAGAPMFSDHKVKVVVFPQVDVGSVLTLRYERKQLKPELPSVFSMREVFDHTVAFKAADLTVVAPTSMNLHVESSGIPGGAVQATRSETREWHWTLPESSAVTAESGSVSVADLSPYVIVSSLGSYEDLAKAYLPGATAAARVTPAIQSQADQITHGIADKRAQAEALYRWVSANIRYVAIVMDVGGYVPHSADMVLQARYGDCKDHVALLEALLAAKGMEGRPVLVDALNSYKLPKTAALSAFDHAITYLPAFKLFVDSTSGFATFGVLSASIDGKTALVTDAGSGRPSLMSIPLTTDTADRVVVDTTGAIAPDGTITGTNVVKATGVYDLAQRAPFSRIPVQQLPQVADMLLARSGQRGSAALHLQDLRNLEQPFSYKADFTLPGRINIPGPGAFFGDVGIGSPAGLSGFVASTALPKRTQDFPCIAGLREEDTELTLPKAMTLGSVPAPVQVSSPAGHFASTHTHTGDKLIIKRVLDLKFQKATCNAADYSGIKTLTDAASKDLRAQILYQ